MPFNRELEDELIESSAKPLTRDQLIYALAIAQKQLDRIERYVNDDREWYSANEQEMLTLQSKRKNIKYFINFYLNLPIFGVCLGELVMDNKWSA